MKNAALKHALERRRSARFPIRCKLQSKIYKGRSATLDGNGETLNMSSSGVLFHSDCDCPVAGNIELSIDWPVQPDENCVVKLVIQGRFIRHENSQFAVKIQRFEFRKQAASRLDKSTLGRDVLTLIKVKPNRFHTVRERTLLNA
jgi:hypothetical protein